MATNGHPLAQKPVQAQTVSELYPSPWLRPADLDGRAVTVKIAKVTIEEIRQVDGTKAKKAVLTFEKANRRMILNVTQCRALAAIVGSERFADWPGYVVVLAPATASNGKATIAIRPAPAQRTQTAQPRPPGAAPQADQPATPLTRTGNTRGPAPDRVNGNREAAYGVKEGQASLNTP